MKIPIGDLKIDEEFSMPPFLHTCKVVSCTKELTTYLLGSKGERTCQSNYIVTVNNKVVIDRLNQITKQANQVVANATTQLKLS